MTIKPLSYYVTRGGVVVQITRVDGHGAWGNSRHMPSSEAKPQWTVDGTYTGSGQPGWYDLVEELVGPQLKALPDPGSVQFNWSELTEKASYERKKRNRDKGT